MTSPPNDLGLASAVDLVALYRSGAASPVEATRETLARAHFFQDEFNAFVLIDDERALADARASETRWQKQDPAGPLDGVPTTIKDLILTEGWPTRRGSVSVDPDQDWTDDAPVVSHLRASGAVMLGKTTTPEMGWKGVTDSPLSGITRNPWDRTKTPGGSSGGASAAAALGCGALHIGSDGGGSVRIPAAFTGIFGHKTTFGRVPAWPLSPFGTLANIGPMTRTVSDAALMLNVIARPDNRDWYTIPTDQEDYSVTQETNLKGLRIAYCPSFTGVTVDPDVADTVAAAAAQFSELGAIVEQAGPDIDMEMTFNCFTIHWSTGAHFIVKNMPRDKQSMLEEGFLQTAEQGGRYSANDLITAEVQRRELGTRLNSFFQKYDLMLTPMMPITAFEAGQITPNRPDGTAPKDASWLDWSPFSYLFNLSRHPACSIPCGFAGDLPVGLQIIGRHYEDGLVLRAARAFEAANPITLPPVTTAFQP